VTEQKTLVDMVRAALAGDGGPIITRQHAVQKISAIFDIDNVEAVLEEIDKEVEERSAKDSANASEEIRAAMSQLTKPKPNAAGAIEAEAGTGQGPERSRETAPGRAV
jgi:hypothetical protein